MFEYIDCGSFDEITLNRNVRDFDRVQLRQRVLKGVEGRSPATKFLGQASALPVAISSVGLAGYLSPGGLGEIQAARAAAAAGVPSINCFWSVASMEEVAEASGVPPWVQIYLLRDKAIVENLLDRARAIQSPVLVVTVDAQVPAQRRRDIKNQLALPPKLSPRNLLAFAARPKWSLASLLRTRPRLGNLESLGKFENIGALMHWAFEQTDPGLDWSDIAWLRSKWPHKLLVKGILDPADAIRAVEAGVDAISVSNHGGVMMDGSPSTIAALPYIADAVADRLEIYLDGGVRSGQDVFKALALGARGCLLGRAHLYALGADGERGVSQMLQFVRSELDIVMAHTGCRAVDDIDGDALWRPAALAESAGMKGRAAAP